MGEQLKGSDMYEYSVNIRRVVDGDTVDVDVDLGFDVWMMNKRIRIRGIDAPETRTADKVEKIYGVAAKDRLKQLLGSTATLKTYSEKWRGKYGRIIADFRTSAGDMVSDLMVDEGHAVRYDGQSRDRIRSAHQRNRIRLGLHHAKMILEPNRIEP